MLMSVPGCTLISDVIYAEMLEAAAADLLVMHEINAAIQ